MKTREYRLVLKRGEQVGDGIPPALLAPLFSALPTALGQAILMAYEGRSTEDGRTPSWVTEASDVRFLGAIADGDAVLRFDAPELGHVAATIGQQEVYWPDLPDPTDTGFDLLADVLSDVRAGNKDSEKFDLSLLGQIETIGSSLDGVLREIDIIVHGLPSSTVAVLDNSLVASARSLSAEIPEPQRVRVVGMLDTIQTSGPSFTLRLVSGDRIRGVLIRGDPAAARTLVGQQVLVLGTIVYRPSGRPLRIDAEAVLPGGKGNEAWSTIPNPVKPSFTSQEIRQPQTPSTGAAAIFNEWPGNESEEELLSALEAMG